MGYERPESFELDKRGAYFFGERNATIFREREKDVGNVLGAIRPAPMLLVDVAHRLQEGRCGVRIH